MVATPRLDGQIDLARTAKIGIRLCQEENWPRAFDYLSAVAASNAYAFGGNCSSLVIRSYRGEV